jgi:hypothetical protein
MIARNSSPLSPHMYFSMTHLLMNENTCSIGVVKYLSLQNGMHFKFYLSKMDYIVGLTLSLANLHIVVV